jgi:prepilin-type N-terminal cleavage/methylation domain-containing protein
MLRSFCSDNVGAASRAAHSRPRLGRPTRGFTLVEMLVAMAITLVMMAAVVTLFANISGSVRNRRATAEMSGQLRHVRNVMQQDLQGATCPGTTWQRPESNHGYIELIEGQYRDSFPSMLTDGNQNSDRSTTDLNGDGQPDSDELDLAQSIIPGANDGTLVQRSDPNDPNSPAISTASGLGDYDDILMLTTRNEHEPFAGRAPLNVRDSSGRAYPFNAEAPGTQNSAPGWDVQTITSPLAEVIWFAIENPSESENPKNSFGEPFFGEPGMRTIYRRALLIVPHVNLYRGTTGRFVDTFQTPDGRTIKAELGLLRVLPSAVGPTQVDSAIAAIIAFQDRYDISARLEWDHNIQRWKIMANTLGDLTKRENRYGHYGVFPGTSNSSRRIYPYPLVSFGSGYQGSRGNLAFAVDPDIVRSGPVAKAVANLMNISPLTGVAVSYSIDPGNLNQPRCFYETRPFAYIDGATTGVPSTAQAMLNDEGRIIRVVHGPVPLWGARRGQDVMMTSALAFDVRIYDPGAPLFGMRDVPGNTSSRISLVVSPSDAGYGAAYMDQDNMGSGAIGTGTARFPFVGQGTYVDMGYGSNMLAAPPRFGAATAAAPWFFVPRALGDVLGNQLAPGFAVYDTWSFHYENNGVNEDSDETEDADGDGIPSWQLDNNNGVGTPSIDEGTNGREDFGHYQNAGPPPRIDNDMRLGVDDVGERETAPPYDRPLRGVQVLMRVYEPDSRAIRQVRVNQHFMPE